MAIPRITEIPKDSDSFLLWFGIGAFGLMVSAFGFIAKRVYPTWIKNKLELEKFQAHAMAESVDKMTGVLEKHLDRFESHTNSDEKTFMAIREDLHALHLGQQRMIELQLRVLLHGTESSADLQKELETIKAEQKRLSKYHEAEPVQD
jgi:hypothetical protein